jgi:hypothetical protein
MFYLKNNFKIDKAGIPHDQLRFVFNGTLLSEESTLAENNIIKESTIRAVLRVRDNIHNCFKNS